MGLSDAVLKNNFMQNVLDLINGAAEQLSESNFEPNNNQRGLAATAAYHMSKSGKDRITKLVITFPPGHGKSRVVPTFLKAMFMAGKASHAKIIFLHEEQMNHDMPIIKNLLRD